MTVLLPLVFSLNEDLLYYAIPKGKASTGVPVPLWSIVCCLSVVCGHSLRLGMLSSVEPIKLIHGP